MIRCTHYSMPAGGQTTEHKGKIRADGQYIRGNRLSIWDDEYYTHLNTKGLMIPEKILNLNELVVLKSYSGLHVSTSNPPDGLYLRTYHASSTIISRSPTPVPFLSWGPYLPSALLHCRHNVLKWGRFLIWFQQKEQCQKTHLSCDSCYYMRHSSDLNKS